ncbi:Putative transcriptional regulator, TetR family OS=Tsukamurella paurometabola (strain ATCC 8368 /DSM / CCUG 35730 / CIP 100753 / JCM 10117 / KCTC 9821/ NBRC 16120 / NCIMB 702349 / NCTC 13040) OX=521096 GN=Tpau_3495 PE=4 SV=1 [Tsukamurella paurometabola]|nr:transcriptional repressor BetI [Tsukamurella paurometabola]
MGRVQHYFRSRDEILRHSLESLIRLAQDTLTESSSPRDSLNRLLTHAIPRSEAERRGSKVWYTYLAEAITDPSISAIVNTVLQGTEDHATALLDGDRIRARTVLAAADGIAYRTLVGQLTPAQAEDAIEALIGPA